MNSRLRGKRCAERGAMLLTVIVAIVVMGAAAAVLAAASSASHRSSVELTQLINARYLAESGVLYAKGIAADYQKRSKDIDAAVAALNANFGEGAGTVAIPGAGTFVITATADGGGIEVVSVGRSGPGLSAVRLTATVPYSGSSGEPAGNQEIMSGQDAYLGGTSSIFTGNVVGGKITVQGGSTITGSVIQTGGAGTECLNLQGVRSLGTPGKGTYICSNTCVTATGIETIDSDITAQGDIDLGAQTSVGMVSSGGSVTYAYGTQTGTIGAVGDVMIKTGTINGDVHAGRDVTLVSGTVNGSIYATGNVILEQGRVTGKIYAGGDVTIRSVRLDDAVYAVGNVTVYNAGPVIKGTIHLGGVFTDMRYGKDKNVVHEGDISAPEAPEAPKQCAKYSMPQHRDIASTTDLNFHGGRYTFYGSTNPDDTTNAFKSISSGGWSQVCFDLSEPDTYMNIFVNGNVNITGTVYVRASKTEQCFTAATQVTNLGFANSAAASRIYMDAGGSVSFGGGSNWVGTVVSGENIYPDGDNYIGAFYANGYFNPDHHWFNMLYVPSDYVKRHWR